MNKTLFNAMLAITIAIFVGAWFYSGKIKSQYSTESESDPQSIQDRIRPVAEVAIAGVQAGRSAPVVETGPVAAPVVAGVSDTGQKAATTTDTAADTSSLGKDTYKVACFACHTTGVAGSPKLGDKGAWAPRIAQGVDMLNEHALKGFQGSTGVMPPKGGRVDLSDEAIIAAVAYIVQESGGQ